MLLRHNTQNLYKKDDMVPLGQTIQNNTIFKINICMTLKVDLELKSLK